MSTKSFDKDGFQIVKSKSRSKKNRERIVQKHNLEFFEDCSVDKDLAKRRINSAKEDLLKSDYFKSFIVTIENSFSRLQTNQVAEILSYGLGHIGECTVSQYQLALLLCLKDKYSSKCLVHDPIFWKDECDLLKTLSIEVIRENEEGKRTISNDGISIVYMPHCPKQLTNNFLWKNWSGNLKNCVLISNSFQTLFESQPRRILEEYVPYVLNIFPIVEESPLINNFKFNDIFNDISIHIFPENSLSLLPNTFWNVKVEPVYSDNVELISSKLVEKLVIE